LREQKDPNHLQARLEHRLSKTFVNGERIFTKHHTHLATIVISIGHTIATSACSVRHFEID
jgi:hypothetical protein